VLLSTIFQCNDVVRIGSLGLGSTIVTSLWFIVFYGITRPIKLKFSITILIVFLLLLFTNSILKSGITNILVVAQLFIYYLCARCIHKISRSLNPKECLGYVNKVLLAVILFAPIQYVATIGLLPRDFLSPFFFNDFGDSVYFHYPERYQRLLSTFLEPSFCAPFLVGSFYYFLHMRGLKKNNIILLSFILIELLLTKSSTGFLSFFIIGVFYLLLVKGIKWLIRFSPLLIVLLAVIAFLGKDVLNDVIFDKMSTDSGKYRAMQDLNSIEMFMHNKLLGVGYGTMRSSSLLITMLAEIGMVGAALFLYYIYVTVRPLLAGQKISTKYDTAVRLFFLNVVLSQLIAIPDLQYCVFWLSIYLISLSNVFKQSKYDYSNRLNSALRA
jgi:hypothetical protein